MTRGPSGAGMGLGRRAQNGRCARFGGESILAPVNQVCDDQAGERFGSGSGR